MRKIAFDKLAFEQFTQWATQDKKIYTRIVTLIDSVLRTPFEGIGKPEPLKHNLKGCWSRRINNEHRLVYRVTEESIIILSCKFHYQ